MSLRLAISICNGLKGARTVFAIGTGWFMADVIIKEINSTYFLMMYWLLLVVTIARLFLKRAIDAGYFNQ